MSENIFKESTNLAAPGKASDAEPTGHAAWPALTAAGVTPAFVPELDAKYFPLRHLFEIFPSGFTEVVWIPQGTTKDARKHVIAENDWNDLATQQTWASGAPTVNKALAITDYVLRSVRIKIISKTGTGSVEMIYGGGGA